MQKRGVVGSTRLNFPNVTHVFILFWPVASAFLPLPIQLLSLICITTLDGSITQYFLHLFAYLICLLFHLLLILASFTFLPVATCRYRTSIRTIAYIITNYTMERILSIVKFTQCNKNFKPSHTKTPYSRTRPTLTLPQNPIR